MLSTRRVCAVSACSRAGSSLAKMACASQFPTRIAARISPFCTTVLSSTGPRASGRRAMCISAWFSRPNSRLFCTIWSGFVQEFFQVARAEGSSTSCGAGFSTEGSCARELGECRAAGCPAENSASVDAGSVGRLVPNSALLASAPRLAALDPSATLDPSACMLPVPEEGPPSWELLSATGVAPVRITRD